MSQILFWIDGGTRRYQERRVSCRCGWWAEVGGEEVDGIWFAEVPHFECESCGQRVICLEGEQCEA